MNFLITNMTGYRNKGCEALTKSIIGELKKIQENTKFTVFTEDLDYDTLWGTEPNVSFIVTPFRKKYFFGEFSFLPGWLLYPLIRKLMGNTSIGKAIKHFKQTDAVISTGGDIFSSTYGDLTRHLSPIKTAAFFGKPAFLLGHSVGPFENQGDYKLFVKNMTKVKLITVRESLSLEYLQKMNLKHTKIELTADTAFCLNPKMDQVDKIFKSYNIPKGKILVGVAPSQGISCYSGVEYENHVKVLLDLLSFLIKLDCHLVLLPHVQLKSVLGDDRVICELLYRKLGFSENVTVLSFTHSAEEIRGIVSKFDLMITERMHAAIACLSQNVPTFVIGYSVKAKGILGDIFGFGSLQNYLMPVKKIDVDTLKNRVKNLLDRRIEVAKYLSKVMPDVTDSARRNFTLIKETLEQ